jgi:RNA polymerase sigma factor (sigma-70 family)
LTKDGIILQVFSNEKIIRYCKTICPQDTDELLSELVIQLYKMDYQKLLIAYNASFLEYTCFRICKRIVYGNISDSGIFYRKEKTNFIDEFSDEQKDEDETEIRNSERLEKIKEILEGKHWYGKTLFKLYYIDGYNLREISERYGINLKSVYYTINKLKKEIKKELYKQ